MKRYFVLTLVFVLIASLFSGVAIAQEPTEGGDLILRVPRELTLPDLPPYAQAGGPELSWPVFETLVWLDAETAEYTGCLAKDWETEDQKTWTIELREGVKWHDGEPFNAEDVVFSFNLVSDPAVPQVQMYTLNKIVGYEEYTEGNADTLEGVKALDSHTVEVTLKDASPQFGLTMARVPMLPKHKLEDLNRENNMEWDFWRDPVGTGPFSYGERSAGEFIRFEKFEDYWRQEPYLDSITFRQYKEKGPFLLDLYSRRVHGTSLVYPYTLTDDELENVKSDPDIDYLTRAGMTVRGLIFNVNEMTNKRVRKALTMALDIPELAEIIGTVDPTRSVFAQPKFRSPEVDENFVYDPEKAKQILEEEGWDFDREIKLITYYQTKPFRDLLAAIQAYWSRIGVKVNVTHMDTSVFVDTWYKQKDADILWAGFGQLPGYPSSEGTFWLEDQMYPSGGNISYTDPKAEEFMDKLSTETDSEAKVDLAHQFDEFAYDEYYHVVFYSSVEEALINSRVHNFNMWWTVLSMDMKLDQWWMEPAE